MNEVEKQLIILNLKRLSRKLIDRDLSDEDIIEFPFNGNVTGTYFTIRVEKKYGRTD